MADYDVLAYGVEALAYGEIATQSGQAALKASKPGQASPGKAKPGSAKKPKIYPRSPFKTGPCVTGDKDCGPDHTGMDVFFAGIDIGTPVVAMEDCTVTDVMGSKERGDASPNAVIVKIVTVSSPCMLM